MRLMPSPIASATTANRSGSRRLAAALTVVGVVAVAACASGDSAEAGKTANSAPAADAGLLGNAMSGVRPDGRDDAANDSGPDVRVELRPDSVRLVMDAKVGDQINALQPPVLELPGGSRLSFRGTATTPDSAYFVGDVVLMLSRATAPTEATLHTSYCRAGERLCRSVSRTVQIVERAGD